MVTIDKQKEKQLVLKLRKSNYPAFETLYNFYSPQVYNFVHTTLFNKLLAEDITQNCFVKIWERREELDESKEFSSYLFTVARNMVYREYETYIRDTKYLTFIKNLNTNDSQTIEDSIHSQFILQKVYALIEELPPIRKKIFILSRIKGYSNKKIATELSISVRTVETQIYRSLLYLREKLKHFLVTILIYLLF